MVGTRAGEGSQLVRRELVDPGAILMGGLVTANQKAMSLPRVLGPAVEKTGVQGAINAYVATVAMAATRFWPV